MSAECKLCDGPLSFPCGGGTPVDIVVPDRKAIAPNEHGMIQLVMLWTTAKICPRCFDYAAEEVYRKKHAQHTHAWETWEQDGRMLAYHAAKDHTWELLPTGRPKKVERVLPPWRREQWGHEHSYGETQ